MPDLLKMATDIERYGAHGITVHPREDERHIRYADARALKPLIHTEFNIEGFPSERWLKLVEELKPEQATLVPDGPGQLTSDHGWDTKEQQATLKGIIPRLKAAGCRVSLFIDPKAELIDGAKEAGADRIELYTGPYAVMFDEDPEAAIRDFRTAATHADHIGLGVNAGHDLNLNNLAFFCKELDVLDEVSIGHAIISDALYEGLEKTIKSYLKALG